MKYIIPTIILVMLTFSSVSAIHSGQVKGVKMNRILSQMGSGAQYGYQGTFFVVNDDFHHNSNAFLRQTKANFRINQGRDRTHIKYSKSGLETKIVAGAAKSTATKAVPSKAKGPSFALVNQQFQSKVKQSAPKSQPARFGPASFN